MNNEYIEHYSDAIDYLKKNFTMNEYINNEEIITMFNNEHSMQFNMKFREFIENLNKKYIYLYNYCGLFKHDLNNNTWERVYDIVYNNILIDFDINFIYNNANNIIDILEK